MPHRIMSATQPLTSSMRSTPSDIRARDPNSHRFVFLGLYHGAFLHSYPVWELFIVAHLYPAPRAVALTVSLGIDATGGFGRCRSGAMQDRANGLRRILLPRTWVNRGSLTVL